MEFSAVDADFCQAGTLSVTTFKILYKEKLQQLRMQIVMLPA
jgi:hypothetical protein